RDSSPQKRVSFQRKVCSGGDFQSRARRAWRGRTAGEKKRHAQVGAQAGHDRLAPARPLRPVVKLVYF
ncbi:MAG: hypothetical protein LBP27_02230, partial [Treponema sp.]|nr:hypothetical protein [Treponema sp.]